MVGPVGVGWLLPVIALASLGGGAVSGRKANKKPLVPMHEGLARREVDAG
jgi:hypothetical protein